MDLAYLGKHGEDESPDIHFTKHYGSSDIHMEVAPYSLSRVWVLLINNAIEATLEMRGLRCNQYKPSITIRIVDKGPVVSIQIRDNGVGISEEDLPHIFNPFFTTKPPGAGNMGLGLWICYDIIARDHQGEINVVS